MKRLSANKETVLALDRNFEEMLISAERYACGRRTYIVHDTVTYILGLLPFLSDWCVGVMLDDMKGRFMIASRVDGLFSFGDPCDRQDWEYFYERLKCEQARRKEETP